VAEEIESQEEEEQPESSKKPPMKLIIIILAVAVLAGGGFAGWTMIKESPARSAQSEGASGENAPVNSAEPVVGQMFQLDPFVVNLSDPGGKRYLKAKIELEYVGKEVFTELTVRLPQLRDAILLHLSSKMLDEVQSVDGKVELRNALIKRINQVLMAGKVKNLYFTQFVIQ
jgi:flagellar FliL protein